MDHERMRELVKKLCPIAMVRISPNWDGIPHPMQPEVALVWMIIPSPFAHWDGTQKEIPGFEIPGCSFAVMKKDLEVANTPELITELIEQRFKMAVLSLWEFVGQDITKRNMDRLEKALK